jgi:F-type H+-transporting ATPase subunit b
MTFRLRALAVAALGTAALLGLAAPAHAQTTTTAPGQEQPAPEEEADLDKFEEECVHLINEGHALEDCQESPKKFFAETNEIIWGSIFFVVVAAMLAKFALPAMKKGMAARSDRIRGEISRAEEAKAEAEGRRAEFERLLGDADAESARILAEARAQAETLRRELVARAERDASDLRTRASEDTRVAADRARADLEAQIASLSVDLAQRVVERSLDPQTQRALVDRYIAQLSSGRA